jgi:hypothetical protein
VPGDFDVNELLTLLGGTPANDEAAWRRVLATADQALCTTLLSHTTGLPGWFQDEVSARISKTFHRRRALIETYRDASQALQQAGIGFVLVKGFTHELDADLEPGLRVQGDIDLLCSPQDLDRAQNELRSQGFEFHGSAELSDNHRRPLLKPHNWHWSGDYFDATQPVPVELHHTIWSSQRDRLPTPGMESFWDRRESMTIEGSDIPVFCDIDRLAIAALHVLRHVLRNDVRLGHVWELDRMLRHRAPDAAFWVRWRNLHPAPLRALEVIAFQFACLWFNGEMPATPRQDWNAQPSAVHKWFQHSAFSPLENLTRPNKDVLWLHLALLPRFADRWAVARRRLLPLHVPHRGEAIGSSYVSHVASRSRYHALTLARLLWAGARNRTARSKASQTSN